MLRRVLTKLLTVKFLLMQFPIASLSLLGTKGDDVAEYSGQAVQHVAELEKRSQ
jgi:hypothetical protein